MWRILTLFASLLKKLGKRQNGPKYSGDQESRRFQPFWTICAQSILVKWLRLQFVPNLLLFFTNGSCFLNCQVCLFCLKQSMFRLIMRKSHILLGFCFYRTQVSLVRSMCPVVSHWRFWNLTDVTLADEDTKSILTDNANRTIQGNVAMHVTHPVNLVVKFWTNSSSAIWWQNL